MATEISRLFVAIGAKTDEFHKGIDGVQNKMDNVSKKMKIAGGIMVGAVLAIGTASLKMAGDFDGAMREVNTMMLLSEDEFKTFSKDIQNLARDMGVNAVEAANALYQAISAGVPKENAIDFLTVASKAAIGGVTDTKTAVDGLTTVLNAFKKPMSEAQNVADLMFTTVKGGKTTFPELAAGMSTAAPLAATLGVKFEDLMAAVATLTKQGVPTAQAFTQIQGSLVALTKPSTEMKNLLEKLGFESGEAMLQTLGYQGSLDALRGATEGNNQVLATAFGRVEGLNAVLGLTGENLETAKADMDAMANSTGAATDAFDQMEMSTGRQLEKLKVQFQDIAITIGTALMPTLKKLLETITPIITKVGDWISKHPQLTTIILASVGALGALMLLAGPLLKTIQLMTLALHSHTIALIAHKVALIAASIATKIAAVAQWLLNAAMSANPIGLIILAIAGLVAAIVWMIKNWDTVVEHLTKIWEWMKTAFQAVVNFFKKALGSIADFFKNTWEGIKNFFQRIWDGITGIFRAAWDGLVNIAKTAVNFVLRIINGMITGFEGALNFIIRGINAFIGLINKPIELLNKIPGVNLPIIPTIGKITLPRIPLLDLGGVIEGPGLFAVGRGVKEIVREPGTDGNAVNNFYISELVVREEADIHRIARELYRLQQSKQAAMGVQA